MYVRAGFYTPTSPKPCRFKPFHQTTLMRFSSPNVQTCILKVYKFWSKLSFTKTTKNKVKFPRHLFTKISLRILQGTQINAYSYTENSHQLWWISALTYIKYCHSGKPHGWYGSAEQQWNLRRLLFIEILRNKLSLIGWVEVNMLFYVV